MITHSTNVCPYCQIDNSIVTDFKGGSIVCTNCGVVLQDHIIDEEYEERGLVDSNGNLTSRIGLPSNTLYEEQLGTNLILKNKNDFFIQRKRAKTSELTKLFLRADELCQELQYPKIVYETSKDILYRIYKENKIGKNKDAVIAIVFYKCLKKVGTYRPLKNILKKLSLTLDEAKRCYSSIQGYITDNHDDPQKYFQQIEGNYVLFINNLKIDKKYQEDIHKIGKVIYNSHILEGKNPGTVAGAVIYLCSQLFDFKISLETIAHKTSISQKALKTSFLIIAQNKKLIPPEYSDFIQNIEY